MSPLGDLRHPVTIESPVDTSDGVSGGLSRTWEAFISGWAQIRPVSANERFFAGKLESNVTHRVKMRYRPGVKTRMRVNYTVGETTRYFQIHGAPNVDERNEFMMIYCEEGVGS